MNFRECRQGVLLEITRAVNDSIDCRKNFLITGGMRNAYYKMMYRGLELWGMCGCGETNVPGIFDILEIPFETIPAEKIWETFENDKEKDEKFYILPVVRSVLNTEEAELDHYNLVGHSYFLINHIEGDRMYFRSVYQKDLTFRTDEYYITHHVLSGINNDTEWIQESEFEAYVIQKSALKNCNRIKELAAKSELELLENNIATFMVNEKNVGTYKTERYDGQQTYEALDAYLSEILSYYRGVKGTDREVKVQNFVYLQITNFRKMLVAGSDGYYRTEFGEILADYPKYQKYMADWNELIGIWRNFGRTFAMAQSKKILFENTDKILESLIKDWRRITQKETALITAMQSELLEKVS